MVRMSTQIRRIVRDIENKYDIKFRLSWDFESVAKGRMSEEKETDPENYRDNYEAILEETVVDLLMENTTEFANKYFGRTN